MVEVDKLLKAAYWEGLCCDLHVTDRHSPLPPPVELGEVQVQKLRERLRRDGYFTMDAQSATCQTLAAKLAGGVKSLQAAGWPATFIMMFDEAWELVQSLATVMKATTGNRCNHDLVSWFVDADKGDSGFAPHRDRSFGSLEGEMTETPLSFRSTGEHVGLPRYCTFWIALSECHPDNGCLYVIPAGVDPGYEQGDGQSLLSPNSVPESSWGLRMGPTGNPIWSPNVNEAFRFVRALPCSPGDVVCLSHRVLHWGSQGRPDNSVGPRISFSFAGSDYQFEKPYLRKEFRPTSASHPPLRARLTLAAAQMVSYGERFVIPSARYQLYAQLFQLGKSVFHSHYRAKVKSALKQQAAGLPTQPNKDGHSSSSDKSSIPRKKKRKAVQAP